GLLGRDRRVRLRRGVTRGFGVDLGVNGVGVGRHGGARRRGGRRGDDLRRRGRRIPGRGPRALGGRRRGRGDRRRGGGDRRGRRIGAHEQRDREPDGQEAPDREGREPPLLAGRDDGVADALVLRVGPR